MNGLEAYRTLRFTPTFLDTLTGKDSSAAERRAFIKALSLLDADESHPSLRVHELRPPLAGIWSASASRSLRTGMRPRLSASSPAAGRSRSSTLPWRPTA